ncbi:MAG: hypothetical protein E7J99_13005 [Clostridium butyricum]|uniref:hypothetical protein n=1 Tax=Clostridium TaxID=1485 RepID=UPI001FA7C06B|nr:MULTISPECIES: hypothetical protein [unclassified Clostridium]MDU1114626.1 hypothetical protein [Clostridium sp.]MDU7713068.1 hypothetical protein [Clostridium butyricum]
MRSLQERIRDRISLNESKLTKLDLEFHKACCPTGIKGNTSYNDYDTIHGSKKELHMDEWYDLKRRLIVQIELDKATLDSIIDIDSDIEDEEYLKLLETNEQKVSYCRIVKGYSQKETAKLIGISDRQVRRIEQKF